MTDFDTYADEYERAVEHGIGFAGVEHDVYLRAKVDVLLDLVSALGPPVELEMLDVGCGVGAFSQHLVGQVGTLHGVDISSESIAHAGRRVPRASFIASHDGGLPYDDESFDVAFAVCVFHHVDPGQERQQLAFEMRRVVRPGGIVALFEHNPWNPLTRLVVRRIPFDEGVSLLTVGDSRQLLRGAALRDLRSRFILFAPTAASGMRTAEKALGWLPLGAQYVAFARRPER